MSMISDPESWMGLRSARTLDDEATPPPETPATDAREPGGKSPSGLLGRILAFFRRG